ncbi:MAG: hypothetical protein Q4A82_01020 [Corynebacterium sp.]|nr:hypothetical protein [Corynebacterium sp.]
MDYESEIKDLIVQVCQHADIDTASLASKPLPMWCVWLAANTDLVQLHPEPDVIDQGLRTLERELYRRHDRESPVMPSGGWYLLRDCLAQAQQHGYQVSAKQLRHWRARGYVRAAHRRDGTLHYALADVLEKASVD